MSSPYTEGDTAPTLTGTVNAVLTGASLLVNIARPDGTVITHAGTVVDAVAGTWSMSFSTGDLNEDGVYRVEVQVTFSNGKLQTFYYDGDGVYNHFTVRNQIA